MISTVSLETARALKEAGFPQKTLFLWASWSTGTCDMDNVVEFREFLEWRKKREHGVKDQVWDAYAAPTTDELLAVLPSQLLNHTLHIGKYDTEYEVWYEKYGIRIDQKIIMNHYRESLPEALAQMYLWLKKEGLLNGK